ncbi:MAG: hypothetical protein ACTSRU_04320, partial [Candidatus Hodarchaeales archaeon]
IQLRHKSFKSFMEQIKVVLSERYWIIGGLLAIFGWLVYLVALSFYEISLVKPLTNISILVLTICALVIYKEKIKLREWFGVGGLLLSSVLLSISANEKPGKEDMIEIYLIITVIIFFALIFPLLTVFSVFSKSSHKEKFAVPFAIFSGLFYGIGGIFNNVILLFLQDPIILIGFLVLFVSAYGVAFASGQMSIMSGKLTVVYSVETTVIMVVSVIGGSIIFNEMVLSVKTPLESIINFSSVVLIILCVILLRERSDFQSIKEP